MDALIDLLAGPGAPLRDQVRAASCLMSVSFGCMHYQHRAADPAELRAALLDVALELVNAEPAGQADLAGGAGPAPVRPATARTSGSTR